MLQNKKICLNGYTNLGNRPQGLLNASMRPKSGDLKQIYENTQSLVDYETVHKLHIATGGGRG